MTLYSRFCGSASQLSITLVALLFAWGGSAVHAQDRDPTFPDRPSMDKKTTPTQEVIDALDLSNSQVASVDFRGSDPRGDTTFTDVASNFPQEGESYLALSSGCAGAALDPNDEEDFSCVLDNGPDGPGNATDIVRMELELNVPSDASTIQFDLKYLSEEFPEFVGSSFNDAFVVEMGQSTFTVDSNNNLIAPDNLVFDGNGNPITINTTGATGMTSGGAVGTTYDGGTQVLTTTIQVPDTSTVTLVFSIFDVADRIYDSTILLDNFRFQESQNLELVGLEANQAVQDWRNSVQLIEDKSTTVRAFIQSQTSSSVPVGKVRLQGFRNGNPLPGSPLSPSNGGSFQAPPQTSNTSTLQNRRADMSKSLNFKLPSSWQSGTVDLQLTGGTVDCSPAAATNDVCEFQVDFTSVPTPKVRFARVEWTDSGGTTHIPSQAHVREQAKRVIAMYPISTMNWSTFTLDWSNFSYPSPPQLGDVNSALQFVRALSILFGGDADAMYYGDMVDTNNGGLAAGIPASVASGDQQVTPNVAAHELGHVLNQQHSVNQGHNGTTTGSSGQTWKLGYCGPNRAVANTSAPEYPFTNATQNIAALGPLQQGIDDQMWGLSTRTNTPVDPRNHGDLMSYCAFNFGFNWPSSWRYNKLRTDPDALVDRFSSAPTTNEPKQIAEVKLLRGQINFVDNTAQFNSFLTVEAGQSAIDEITPPEGEYTLQLLDPEDNVVNEIPFAPAENHGFGTGIPETATFLVPAPENVEVNEVRLLSPDGNGGAPNQQIASITASPNPPTTTVDFPNGGEDLDGETATFEWTASDPDEDNLSYTVEYSRNGGDTWTALVTDWSQTSIEVDLSTLGQTETGLIRVRASDGFNSASDASDGTFSVPNSPPQPFINTPDSATFDSTSVIPLEGNVNDIEDDQFDDADLSWTSSIDGNLGTGRALNVGEQLSVGTHTITFSATDSGGATGEASIVLKVLPSAGTGLGETPVAEETLYIDADGTYTFGGTGVKVDFFGVNGPDSLSVQKFDSAPIGGTEIAEENVGDFRYVINAKPGLDFDSTEVRFMLDTVSGVSDNISEGDVVIYSRPDEGTGQFSKLETMLDDKGDDDPANDELFARMESFSEFALASDSEPLPVEMADFKATTLGEDQVRLSWQTASETNNAGFEVQRKAGEQGSWAKVGFVESKTAGGTTDEAHSYQFEDANPPYAADELTYRLRQVDLDGSTSLTESVAIQRTVDEVELLGTFPNPTRTRATVRFAVPERQKVTLELYDVLGRRVRTLVDGEREGRQSMQVDVSTFPSGVYFLRLKAEGQMKTQRLTVVK